MIKRRMRKFGTQDWRMINDEHECLFCAFAAEHTIFHESGNAIFIEDDEGNVRLVECLIPGKPVVLTCETTTPEYAKKLIAHESAN